MELTCGKVRSTTYRFTEMDTTNDYLYKRKVITIQSHSLQ